MPDNEHSKRAPHSTAAQSWVVKKMKRLASALSSHRSIVHASCPHLGERSSPDGGPEIVSYCFTGAAGFSTSVAGALAGGPFAGGLAFAGVRPPHGLSPPHFLA